MPRLVVNDGARSLSVLRPVNSDFLAESFEGFGVALSFAEFN